MNWHSGLDCIVERDAPLQGLTTFRIGGRAEFLVTPKDVESFAAAYGRACASGLPVWILGKGSNLLVGDEGVRGIVLSTAGLRGRGTVGSDGTVRVEGGASLRELVSWSVRQGLGGLEFLAGIPGTVGGAVVMNAGGRGGSIGSAVRAVWCVGRDGTLFRRDAGSVAWNYRETDIHDPVVEVEFGFVRDDPERLLERLADVEVSRRHAQPAGVPSAGCFFRNPPGDSAGRLIDAAGMKGLTAGGAAVSARHANFIVNRGGATASDVMRLFGRVRDGVRRRFGVMLENEVRFWLSSSGAR